MKDPYHVTITQKRTKRSSTVIICPSASPIKIELTLPRTLAGAVRRALRGSERIGDRSALREITFSAKKDPHLIELVFAKATGRTVGTARLHRS